MAYSDKAAQPEIDLNKQIIDCLNDPEQFVRTLIKFPDGGEPDAWQTEQLNRIRDALEQDVLAVIREAVSSGHGIGKSALVAWIILWAMSTRPHLAGIVTANTEAQLRTKTWRELSVWHKRCVHHYWFHWTATKFYQVQHSETWFISAIPWSESRPEAFAGLHAEHVLILYDEASAIPDAIWEVSEGAMTTPRAMWFCYGNPTRNTGRFRECFGKFKHRWNHTQIDSRTCKMANQEQLSQWVDDYGEDSDFVRVRVKGEFPRAGNLQFIPSDHVAEARNRNVNRSVYFHMPVLLGVDVARFGDDQSVICVRQGRKVIEIGKYRNLDTVQLAARVIEKIKQFKPQCTFVDVVGIGAGVVDQLVNLGYSILEVNAASTPDDAERYLNKRAEMWGRMKEWLAGEVDIPDDPELSDELTGLEYGYTATKFQIQLEKKEDMKKRGLSSPDCGDALALTFAEHVAPVNEYIGECVGFVLPDDVEWEAEYE